MINKVIINLQIFSPQTEISDIFSAYLQIVLENSAGTVKVKVIEYGADKPFEGIYMPNVVNILESEPLISVSIKVKKNLNTQATIFFSVGCNLGYDPNTSFNSIFGSIRSEND